MTAVVDELIALAHELGNPARDWVILGEGNLSARADADTFWVKASGTRLRDIDAGGFVRVRADVVLALLDQPDAGDEHVTRALLTARGAETKLRGSVETLLHALCLQLDGVHFVAHTHPVAVNAVTCSQDFAAVLAGRIFPDEIVVCGAAPVLVPYADPGLPLARALRARIGEHIQTHGCVPKTVWMQNHGLVVLAAGAAEAAAITAMADKTARILLGTRALGGPRFLSEQDVARIDTRPDEALRQKAIKDAHGRQRASE
jgi:rhamnose utilization protein RhaD (predicted bifunctional aldolase and dehydrogenase)